ncbi:MAG: hypothetical protein SAK29_31765 [Scytonema sp. PMC 1069.18]|nr:hypothetical protein [Scytonema sp. PMC 1069.18]MEC4887092.1 hypothetical protein [Scytonema sp. PMC 1070.18]
MQYTEFTQYYPFLNTLLVEWAAHRIARTADYLEAEARSHISCLQSQIERKKIQMPLTRQIFAEFPHGISLEEFERLAWATDEEYKYLHSLLLEAKYSLSEIKTTTVTPSMQQIQQATEEVKDYIQALAHPSVDVFLKWNSRLSSREKFYIQLLPNLLREKNGEAGKLWSLATDEWGYLDEGYQILTEPVIKSFFSMERLIGAITVNSYGVKCLNAPVTMFVDIDLDSSGLDCSYFSFPWGQSDTQESLVMEAIR